METTQQPILELKNITKRYTGVVALNDVSFSVQPGSVHCLVGENGAGKSTLIKILAGAETLDHGEVLLNGTPVKIANPQHAQQLGLSFIFQEVNVVEQLTVADNFMLGRENAPFGLWNRKPHIALAKEMLDRLSADIDPRAKVSTLGPAQKQLVEIARALAVKASIIVMDEPSAPLTEHELKALFEIIAKLRAEGVTIIYVSHRLSEIFNIGDNYTVLRDSQHVETGSIADISMDKLVNLMVGRDLKNIFKRDEATPGEPVLELHSVSFGQKLRDISLTVRKGEIVGVAGLAGAGRTELANLIFGVTPTETGEILVKGRAVIPRSPRAAIRLGIGLLPEERRAQGIVGVMSVSENISLASPAKISVGGILNRRKEQSLADTYIQRLNIRTPSAQQRIRNLSGGNQQKCVLARWLSTGSDILLLDEPTRGVDVGAKAEVFALMNELAQQGVGILMFSSEMEELLGMSDRILVMNRGRLVGEFPRAEATQEGILRLAASD